LKKFKTEKGPVFVQDLDNDGRKEIVIGPTIYDTDFNVKQRLSTAISEMRIDDLDNDGNQEIIAFYPKSRSYISSTIISVMSVDGEILWNYEYSPWINSYAIADLDNDGFKEILVAGHHRAPITVFGKQ
jgi:hypothetical protein